MLLCCVAKWILEAFKINKPLLGGILKATRIVYVGISHVIRIGENSFATSRDQILPSCYVYMAQPDVVFVCLFVDHFWSHLWCLIAGARAGIVRRGLLLRIKVVCTNIDGFRGNFGGPAQIFQTHNPQCASFDQTQSERIRWLYAVWPFNVL